MAPRSAGLPSMGAGTSGLNGSEQCGRHCLPNNTSCCLVSLGQLPWARRHEAKTMLGQSGECGE